MENDFASEVNKIQDISKVNLFQAITLLGNLIDQSNSPDELQHLVILRMVFLRDLGLPSVALDSLELLFVNDNLPVYNSLLVKVIFEILNGCVSIPSFMRRWLLSSEINSSLNGSESAILASFRTRYQEQISIENHTLHIRRLISRHKLPSFENHPLQIRRLLSRHELPNFEMSSLPYIKPLNAIHLRQSSYESIKQPTFIHYSASGYSLMQHAEVTGGSSFIGFSEELGHIPHLESAFAIQVGLIGDSRVCNNQNDQVIVKSFKPSLQIDEAVNLCGALQSHFAHAYMFAIPSIFQISKRVNLEGISILVDEGVPRFIVEILNALFPNSPITHIPHGTDVSVSKLHMGFTGNSYPPGVRQPFETNQNFGTLDEYALDQFQYMANSMEIDRNSLGDKIYLSREGSSWGRGENEQEVIEFFRSQGFTIVSPEKLSLQGQIALFAGVKVVATLPSSSALNMIYSAYGSKLIVLGDSNSRNWQAFTGILEERGISCFWLNVCLAGNEHLAHPDFNVDIAELTVLLKPLLHSGK